MLRVFNCLYSITFLGNPLLYSAAVNWGGCQLYVYLVEAVERVTQVALAAERQYYQHVPHLFNTRIWANSFRLGCAHRLGDRLREQKQRLESEGIPEAKVNALACIEAYQQEAKAITKWMAENNVKLRSGVKSQAMTARSGYQAGKVAGDAINLSRQLNGN